jgi:PAS domain S-box-containing protein
MVRYALFVFAAVHLLGPAEAAEQRRRVFLLEGLSPTQPAALRTIEALKKRLEEKAAAHVELFFDALELSRIPGPAQEENSARFLGQKYAQMSPDVLVALSRGALQFILEHRNEIGRHIPVVYCCTAASAVRDMNLPREIVGVVSQFNWPKTLALAAQLQPGARNLVIVSGASEYDKRWQEDALRDLEPQLGRYNVRVLPGLPLETLRDEVARLSVDTIVLMLPIFVDGSGEPQVPPDVTASVAKASGAPLYASLETFLGRGIVGGYMDTFEAHGAAVADLVLQLLAGKAPASLPSEMEPEHRFVVDARQLERWNFSESSLPPDSSVKSRTPSVWAQHRSFVIGVACVFVVMTAILGLLLLQMARRRKAESSLRESEERLTIAASSTNTGLWQYDVQSGRLWATAQCREMFGLDPRGQLEPNAFLRAVHPSDQSILSSKRPWWEPGSRETREFRVLDRDGQTRWILASSNTHLDGEGRPQKVSGVFRDITSRKMAEQQADQLSERLSTIQEEERQQIAQELHDSTAQYLVAASLNMMMLHDRFEEDQTAGQLCDDIRGCLDEATKELRTYTYLLHAPQLKKDGFAPTLRCYVDGFTRRTTLEVNLRIASKVEDLTLSSQHALLRVVQEALGNVHRHASASRVSIAIKCIADRVHIAVSDNGCGIDGTPNGRSLDSTSPGVGIPGMRARLRRLEGDLRILSRGRGTMVHGVVPVHDREAICEPTEKLASDMQIAAAPTSVVRIS